MLLSALEPERHPIEDKLAAFSRSARNDAGGARATYGRDAKTCGGSSALERIDYRRNRLRLQLEVVDGAIASAKVFGQIVSQSEEGSLNLTGIMTAVRTMWFILITLVCLILSAGTITDWMKDSYSIFLLQSGLSRAQVYLGILTATWLLLGAFIALTTFSLELLLETKLKVEFAGIRQAGLASWLHLFSLLAMWFAVLPRRTQWQGAMLIGLIFSLLASRHKISHLTSVRYP